MKRRAYQDAGVETYWVVDADRRVVEVWHPGDELPEIAVSELRWKVAPEAPELNVDLGVIFAPLPGETGR